MVPVEIPIDQRTDTLKRKALLALRKGVPAAGLPKALSKDSTAVERRGDLRELWVKALEVDGNTLKYDWNLSELVGQSRTCTSPTSAMSGCLGLTSAGRRYSGYPTTEEPARFLEQRG